MEWLAPLESFGPIAALKTSFYVYPLVNALHILAIGAVVTSVLLMDLRLLGAFPTVERGPFVALLRRLALAAFVVAVASGLMLFSIRARDYAGMPVFLAKMALIALGGANFVLMTRLEAVRTAPQAAMKASAAMSMVVWIAVLVCGRFIGFL
jgi:hypothetical protein